MTRKSIGKLHSDNASKRNPLQGLRWLQPIVTGACFLLVNVQIAEFGIGTSSAEAGEKSELPKSTLVSSAANRITQAEFDRLSLCQTRVLSYCNSIAGTNPQEFALELIVELTTLDDDDLAAVKYLPQLTSFDLLSVNTNEAALRHLTGLAQIKSLKIRDPEVSGKELAELVRSLPNLELIEIRWFFHAESLWRWP